MNVDKLTVERLEVSNGNGPKIIIEAGHTFSGIWLSDNFDKPSLGIVMEKDKPPYLAFYVKDYGSVPAAISVDPDTGKIYLQEAQK